MSLSINETVIIGNNERGIPFRVQAIEATNQRISVRKHHAAGSERDDAVMLTMRLNPLKKLGFQKAAISVLGEAVSAND